MGEYGIIVAAAAAVLGVVIGAIIGVIWRKKVG